MWELHHREETHRWICSRTERPYHVLTPSFCCRAQRQPRYHQIKAAARQFKADVIARMYTLCSRPFMNISAWATCIRATRENNISSVLFTIKWDYNLTGMNRKRLIQVWVNVKVSTLWLHGAGHCRVAAVVYSIAIQLSPKKKKKKSPLWAVRLSTVINRDII